MKRILLSAALLLAGAGVAAADHYQKYFPLDPGTTWTYENLTFPGASTTKVTYAGSGYSYVTNVPSLGNVWLGWSGNTLYVWDAGQSRWEPLFRFGAATGTSYAVRLSGSALWQNVVVTVQQKAETVYLQRQDRYLTNCVRFTLQFPDVADAGLEEVFFAPYRGLVRFAETSIAGPVEQELLWAVYQGKSWGVNPVVETLDGGWNSQFPVNGTNQIKLLNSQTALNAFWSQHNPGESAPAVDFSKRTVLVVLAGQRPNPNYSVKVDKVLWNYPYNSVTVHVDEVVQSGFVIQVVANPFHIVVLEKKVYSASVKWEVIQAEANEPPAEEP